MLQFLNALPIFSIASGRCTSFNTLQRSNASLPITFAEDGRATDTKDLHKPNVSLPIASRPSENDTFVNPIQLKNVEP